MAAPIQNSTSLMQFRVLTDELPRVRQDEGASFGDLFKKAINDASDLQAEAQNMIGAFVRGEPVELHQVMAAAEEANLSLELLVEIRNKLTEAYRTVMNLQ
jgi:flagellar hook-basal body complex protein FliE